METSYPIHSTSASLNSLEEPKQAQYNAVPVSEAGSQEPKIQPITRTNTQRRFSRNEQRKRLLLSLSWRLALNLTLCAVTAGVLIAYEHKSIIPNSGKYLFNASITGLSLGIGLNIAAGLIQIAQYARWWLLSRRPLMAEDFENVFQCDSQVATLKLLISRKVSWLVRFCCVLWLAFNVGIQIIIALLGLTYSLGDPADNGSLNLATKIGTASVPLLSVITDQTTQYDLNLNVPVDIQQSIANSYGLQQGNYISVNASESGSGLGDSFNALYFQDDGFGDIAWYHFFDDQSTTINEVFPSSNVVSNRAIFANASCTQNTVYSVEQNNTAGSVNVTFEDSGATWFEFGISVETGDTIFYSQIDPINIGPREALIYAFAFNGSSSHAFVCNSYVSPTGNYDYLNPPYVNTSVTRDWSPKLLMPDLQARILAGAIGWPLDPEISTTSSVGGWQAYPSNSTFAIPLWWDAEQVSDFGISIFSIAAITAIDNDGPRVNATDITTPNGGLSLSVQWNFAAPILALIPFLHFVLIAFVIVMLDHVIVRDDSPLANAMLFRPILNHLPHPQGSLLSSKEILAARSIDHHLVYTYEQDENGVATLEAKNVEKHFRHPKRFREGDYL